MTLLLAIRNLKLKGNLTAISIIGTNKSLGKIEFFQKIEIRKNSSFIAIDTREKSRGRPSSSKDPVVSDNRRSDNRDLTVFSVPIGQI